MADSGVTYRTTAAAVAEIVEQDTTIDMDPFIEAANALVTEKCAVVTTYTAGRLELIERWLSAHFYRIRDMPVTQESIKGVTENFQHREDLGFDVTHYGQMAMRLDTNGGLAALNKQIKSGAGSVQIEWLGKENPNLGNIVT